MNNFQNLKMAAFAKGSNINSKKKQAMLDSIGGMKKNKKADGKGGCKKK